MSLVTKWDGSIQTPSNPNNDRTNKLGTFAGINKVNTYYPLPGAYSELIRVISLYKVPARLAGRPDLIAAEVYGDAALWWVVLWANKYIDPFNQPSVGDVINIIDIKALQGLLS